MLNIRKWIINWYLMNWFFTLIMIVLNCLIIFKPNMFKGWLNIVFLIFTYLFSIFVLFLFFKDLRNQLAFFKTIKQSPITMVIGSLGSGKTLLATHLLVNSRYDTKYSNYPIKNEDIALATFDMFDNNNLKNPIPYSESNLVVLDEMALYVPANEVKDGAMKKYSGVIPSLVLMRQYNINVVFIGQREKHHWVEYRELATGLMLPLSCKKPPFQFKGILKYFIWFFPKFKFHIGIFDDKDNYDIWKSESVKRSANGKKVKLKNASSIGMRNFKISISLLDAMKYDTKYLQFVRDVKNDIVKDKSLTYWDYVNFDSLEDLEKMGATRLVENLQKGGK